MTSLEVIHVTWIDSQASIGWEEIKDIEEELDLTHSIGFFVKETKDCIVLANSFDPATLAFNGRIHIPICSIESMRPVCKKTMTTTK